MNSLLWLVSLILLLSTQAFAGKDVRVRVLKTKRPIALQANNLANDKYFYSSSVLSRSKIKIQRILKNNQWLWKVTDQKNKTSNLIENRILVFTGDFMELDKHLAIPGSVSFVGVGARTDVIIKLPLEEYLKGVLPNEMPLSWPMEALKAQVVASRSYTLSVMRERTHLHFDVESTVQDQVFQWVKVESIAQPFRSKMKEALKQTEGEFLTHGNQRYFKAYFHADSGGKTEKAKYVWGPSILQPSYSVKTKFARSPNKHWIRNWS